MKVKSYSVNEAGIAQIHQFLADNHKLGGDHFNREMLLAWAQDAEIQLDSGSSASIEIRAWDAISGHTETFTISDVGLDCEEIEVDE